MIVGWKDEARTTYFGSRRDEIFAGYDKLYGKGNWRLAWRFGKVDVDFLGACALYEDAYFAHFELWPSLLTRLVREASDVYDDAVTNVDSGFDYHKQETNRTHVQDIAIRRCVLRNGVWFAGSQLIQIRDKVGTNPLSMRLSPGQVPFHFPHLIEPARERTRGEQWYTEGSVEDFYQRNRYLQIRA